MKDMVSEQNLEHDLEKIVAEVIEKLGIPANVKGYHYCKNGIMMFIKNDMEYLGKVTTKLYPEIAKRYDTTPSRVERGIRTAIASAWKRGKHELIEEFFYKVDEKPPTNAEFLAMIAEKIKMYLKNNAERENYDVENSK